MDVALVLECARANGDIVSARKGILDLRLTVHGRAAHAGVEPEKGRSAILEAARIVRDLHALNGRWPGVTVNVGVDRRRHAAQRRRRALLARGRRPRRSPREALETAEAEIRRDRRGDRRPGHDRRRSTTMARWWPMEKLERSGRLVDHAQAVAAALGFEVDDTATGGASDANTTSGLGVPTLDGLGPIGGNDHAPGRVPRGRLDRAADDAARRRCCWRSRATRRSSPGASRGDARVTERRRISSGGPVGGRPPATAGRSSSATRAGSPARPTPGPDGRSRHPGDSRPGRAILAIIERALAEAGFGLADVVRTRMFVTDIGRSAEVLAVHGEVFGDIRPAATMVEVSALMRPEPAGRDRGRGAPGLSAVGRGSDAADRQAECRQPAARAMATMATAATRPRNRLRRQATIAEADEDRDPLDADVERRARRRRRRRP